MNNQIDINNEIKVLMNHFNSKNFDFVIQKSLKLVKKFPKIIILYNLLGSSLQNIGNFKGAAEVFNSGLNIQEKYVPIMNNLSNVYKKLGEFKKAENLYKEIIKIDPKHFQVYVNYGNFKRDFNQTEEAIKLYHKALEIDSNNVELHHNLALTYQGSGKFEDSNKHARKCLELNPNFSHADVIIINNFVYKQDNYSISDMEKKLVSEKINDLEKQLLHFSIGKALENKKNYSKAAENFKIGNNIKKKLTNYKIEQDIEKFKKIKNLFEKINFKKININNNDIGNKIFILGLPRSGSTLIEQIISSHSKVYGLGETGYLETIFKKDLIDLDKGEFKKDIENLLDYDFNQIVSKYDNFLSFFNTKKNIFADKSLFNFFHLGFIKIIFPNSKIILTGRNPKDNLLSIYKNSFAGLNWTNDENDINKYFFLYKDLISFWKKKLGNFIYEFNYETLINDHENKIKELLNYCNLKFEDKCLKFYKNKNQVKTASITQVRKDFYKSSINLYKNYDNNFKNLFKDL